MGNRQPSRIRLMPPPPRVAMESQANSQPSSPSPTTTPSSASPQSRPASAPPSPSSIASQAQSPSKASMQPQSPSRVAPQPVGPTSSQPTSPPRTATRVQPTAEVVSLPPSPSKILEPTNELTSQPPISTPATSFAPPPHVENEAPRLVSPLRVAMESQATSQSASPPPTTAPSRAAPLPPSPSRAAPQSRPASVPPSPSSITSQPQSPSKASLHPQSPSRVAPPQPVGPTSSQPSSPPRTTTQAQPTAEVVSLPPPSPSKTLEPTNEVTSQPHSISTRATSFATQQGQEPAPPQPVSQETRSITEIKSETGSDSQNQTPVEATTQPDGITTQGSQASGLEAAAAPRIALQPLPDSTENPKETKEGPEVVQEQRKEKELNSPPNYKTDTELPTVASSSETHTKEQLNVAVKEQKEERKQEIPGKGEIWNTSESNGRMFRTGNSIPPKETNQKPAFLNGKRLLLHKEIGEDITQFVHKLGTDHLNHTVKDKPTIVITLAGANRGASMQMGTELANNKERSVHIRRGYKINPDESVDATTDGNESSRRTRSKNPMNKEDQAAKAYINNNVQSINNSIVFNTSVSAKNPRVQLDLYQNPSQPIGSNGKVEPLETHKAKFNITPAEKLTYQPTVRRRCLRGLLMEPSDYDSDNPDKPRRHGCRYGCWEKGKDNDIDIL